MLSITRRVRAPRPDGARLLDAFLVKMGQTLPAFCDAHHFDRYAIQRALSGKTVRMMVGLAIDVEDATQGKVPVRSWHPSTIRWDSEKPKRARRLKSPPQVAAA